MNRMGWLLRVCLVFVFVILSDVLLRTEAPGLGLAIFALALAATMALRYRVQLLRAGAWNAMWLVLAAGSAFDESVLGKTLLFALAWGILAYTLLPECDSVFTAFIQGTSSGLRSLGAGMADAQRSTRVNERQLARRNLHRMPLSVYFVPLALIGVFAFLLVPANLALAKWLNLAFESILRFLADYNVSRFLFWLTSGCVVYGMLRFRTSRRKITPVTPADRLAVPVNEQAMELRACLLTFAGLNALYVLSNLSDILYLWLNVALPAGVTYAEYAHQGSYRLIVAVALAALTVTVFFRLNAPSLNNRTTRLLAYLFITQNLLVLAGACRRLGLYIDVYGLTRFRVAAFLWMLLVAIGFVLIVIKLARRRPLDFLLRWNTVATVLLLSVVALTDIDGAIANWNVARLEAGESGAVDLLYLRELGAGALPALQRLSLRPDETGTNATKVLALRTMEERQLQNRWQSWTWRRKMSLPSQ